MDNLFGFKHAPFPDTRRRVGEWREIVGDDVLYVESASEYIMKGDGIHKASPAHAALGLEEVEVFSPGILRVFAIFRMTCKRVEILEFDIDFAGFNPGH